VGVGGTRDHHHHPGPGDDGACHAGRCPEIHHQHPDPGHAGSHRLLLHGGDRGSAHGLCRTDASVNLGRTVLPDDALQDAGCGGGLRPADQRDRVWRACLHLVAGCHQGLRAQGDRDGRGARLHLARALPAALRHGADLSGLPAPVLPPSLQAARAGRAGLGSHRRKRPRS